MSSILLPARAFRVTIDLTVPPATGTDAELVAGIINGLSMSLAVQQFQPRVAIEKGAAISPQPGN